MPHQGALSRKVILSKRLSSDPNPVHAVKMGHTFGSMKMPLSLSAMTKAHEAHVYLGRLPVSYAMPVYENRIACPRSVVKLRKKPCREVRQACMLKKVIKSRLSLEKTVENK